MRRKPVKSFLPSTLSGRDTRTWSPAVRRPSSTTTNYAKMLARLTTKNNGTYADFSNASTPVAVPRRYDANFSRTLPSDNSDTLFFSQGRRARTERPVQFPLLDGVGLSCAFGGFLARRGLLLETPNVGLQARSLEPSVRGQYQD